ncbi:hypothetical protein M493_13440 [Geobacillus genomosp. 3]|uniref:DUF3231 family protein n=1 Tax=Geobacillus genomosp. 3 TaxID=1921421 RepID=S5Z1N0_GEOG3|nr:DUF3231 family protein [Geobacillus genomosp. 3]AGT32929.1 hypothetical protein M493_13440 [Geobacillus genomosp. 3]
MEGNVASLTSTEISSLWSTYINDSIVACLLTHFSETVTDDDIRPLIAETLNVANGHLRAIEQLCSAEGIAKPIGYPVEKHVYPGAPKLFSDVFYLEYIYHMSKFGLTSHSGAIAMASRQDVVDLFRQFLNEATDINDRARQLLLEKGVYVRPPYMAYPKEVEFIERQSFLTGWFGPRRPLLAIEVAHLFATARNNEIGKATLTGFAQVAGDPEIRNFFLRGVRVCSDIMNTVHDVLRESDVPTVMSSDVTVTDSTKPPFSDQLMMAVINALSAIGTAEYGAAMAASLRRDIIALYASLITKAGAFTEDGVNMMIDRRWLEYPPHFVDRRQLALQKG